MKYIFIFCFVMFCGTSGIVGQVNCSSVYCPESLTVHHKAGSISPVTAIKTYVVVEYEGHCWLAQNLGASQQASSATDASEASRGWYWQFNKKEAYQYTTSLTPTWNATVSDAVFWSIENDPCFLLLGDGWRLPSILEWTRVNDVGGWDNREDTYQSPLRLSACGYLNSETQAASRSGQVAFYWSSDAINATAGQTYDITATTAHKDKTSKINGMPLRCLREKDIYNAAPDAPSIGVVTVGNGQITVAYTAPANNGGAVITSYTATSLPGGFTGTVNQAGDGSITVSGLTNGTAYTFTVKASNAAGMSAASLASNSVTPGTVPSAPGIGAASRGNGYARVAYSAALNNGYAITRYTATATPGGKTGYLNTAGSGTIQVSGLTNGTAYSFSVKATNALGTGAASSTSNSVTPATVPSAPSVGVAIRGNGLATVAYTAPNNGGSAITQYTATSSPGGKTGTLSTSGSGTITVSGLSNGTAYSFSVKATNALGTGSSSSASNSVTPATVPSAPSVGVATRGNGSATVAYTAPNNGGSAITQYTATSSPGGKTGILNTAGNGIITIAGLTNGIAYSFSVKATNAVGTGAASSASNSVTPATVPSAPTVGVAIRGNGSATVAYTAPNNGGSAITQYTATSSPGGKTGTLSTSGSGTITVSGLSNGTAYSFSVKATNAVGTGAASSASNSVTPATVPSAPTVGVAIRGNGLATVAYTAPNNGGSAITQYTATSSPGGKTGILNTAGNGIITIAGLTNGIAYSFSVKATNALGTGSSSSASNSVTPATVPSAPTVGVAIRGNGSATVAYTAPNNGGSAITQYTATSSPGGKTGILNTAGNGTITVSGLTNGTAYTFTVKATNAVGTGSSSSASNSVTPATVPSAPTVGVAIRGNGSATVAYTAPNNGGSAITQYTATSSPGGKTGTLSTSGNGTITVSGLSNGTAYTFTVKATNAVGTGSSSSASNSVTPATVPSAPTVGVAIRGNGSATVAYTAPYNGGSSITKYTATSSPGGKTGILNTAGNGTISVSGLTNGTPYRFSVKATNALGTGAASSLSASVTPATVPSAPSAPSVTSGTQSNQLDVAYTAPYNGGSAITKYTVACSNGAKKDVYSAGDGSLVFTGLTNGTAYSFTVKATNSVGTGASSSASSSKSPVYVIPTRTSSGTGKVWMANNLTGGDSGYYIWSQALTACPSGFRLPTKAELEAELANFSPKNATGASSALGLTMRGYKFLGGEVWSDGQFGFYQSSDAANGEYNYYLFISATDANINNYKKTQGNSVRCIKD